MSVADAYARGLAAGARYRATSAVECCAHLTDIDRILTLGAQAADHALLAGWRDGLSRAPTETGVSPTEQEEE